MRDLVSKTWVVSDREDTNIDFCLLGTHRHIYMHAHDRERDGGEVGRLVN